MFTVSAESPEKLSAARFWQLLVQKVGASGPPAMIRAPATDPTRRDETIRLHLDRRSVALPVALCAIPLGVLSASASFRSGSAGTGAPIGCGAIPAWILAATLQQGAEAALPGCFSAQSSQAEAVLSIANNRAYAQLITVSGAALDLTKSSFAHPLEGSFSASLAGSGHGGGASAVLLGPGERAILSIDRPAPGGAVAVHLYAAPDNAFAVAAVTWTLLSAASERGLLDPATAACTASVLAAALHGPPHPESALRRVHSCIDAAPLSAGPERLLRALAGRLLRGVLFKRVIRSEGTEPHPARIAFTIPASNPELVNPEIRLGPASYPTVTPGRRTIAHMSATGGTPPYRFYLVPEPGGPGVPSWLRLAADGTLTLEPPLGATAVTVPVEVVDSTGEHSVVSN